MMAGRSVCVGVRPHEEGSQLMMMMMMMTTELVVVVLGHESGIAGLPSFLPSFLPSAFIMFFIPLTPGLVQ
jgi:hypothetical protein